MSRAKHNGILIHDLALSGTFAGQIIEILRTEAQQIGNGMQSTPILAHWCQHSPGGHRGGQESFPFISFSVGTTKTLVVLAQASAD